MTDISPDTATDTAASEGTGEGTGPAPDAGTYELLLGRLRNHAIELANRAETLNSDRLAVFGGSEMALLGTERIRTENNCVPRDIVAVGDTLLFGYNVFVGLRSEVDLHDVFTLHTTERTDHGLTFNEIRNDDPRNFLADPGFRRDFSELYKYYRDASLLQLRRTEGRLLMVFRTAERIEDAKVFRWEVSPDGDCTYIDNRGERDHVFPASHDFEWIEPTRDDHVLGRHPHISIRDQVFVETVGGNLTIKVEDNTEEGQGIYAEPVDEAHQSLADADVLYAAVGPLILLRIRPYNEAEWRNLVFNTRSDTVTRIDAIGASCRVLPEDHGIIFPGGYYLASGETKTFETGIVDTDLEFTQVVRSPNGEDVLYVFHAREEGNSLLLSYNLIRKQVAAPINCNGYSLFNDGLLTVFRSTTKDPTRVHPMQTWQTPFMTDDFASRQPVGESPLDRIGNADLVRGISDALSLRRLVEDTQPSIQIYEDLIAACARMEDAYHWLSFDDVGDLATIIEQIRTTGELVLDEFEKVRHIQSQANEALTTAATDVTGLIRRIRGEDSTTTDQFVANLADLRRAQGRLISLKEMRYMNSDRVAELEIDIVASFEELSERAVEFLTGDDAFDPYHQRIDEIVAGAEAITTNAEALPLAEEIATTSENLELLTEVVGSLHIDDAVLRTGILEKISEVLGALNRARAILEGRRKELMSAEGRAEFAAEFALLSQAVTGALATADTPERCDEQLARLMMQVETLEARFGEFDDFLTDLADKREDIYEAFSAKKQSLLDARQRRSARMAEAADRILESVSRRVASFEDTDAINTFFASDPMVAKVRDLGNQLRDLGAAVKAEEMASKLKAARDDAARSLRDRNDLYEDGAKLVRFGQHRFAVNTQPIDLALVPSSTGDAMDLTVTGTDFHQRIDDEQFAHTRPYWNQLIVSETDDVYRGEYLATSILASAEHGEADLSLPVLHDATREPEGLISLVRKIAEDRYEEGYERGVHDHDAALILEKLLALYETADLLRFPPRARMLAMLFWAFGCDETQQERWKRRAHAMSRIRSTLAHSPAIETLTQEFAVAIGSFLNAERIDAHGDDVDLAGVYLFEELAQPPVKFVVSAQAHSLVQALHGHLSDTSGKRDFDDDLAVLADDLSSRYQLVYAWLDTFLATTDDAAIAALAPDLDEAVAMVLTERHIDTEPSSALVTVSVEDLLGQHPRVSGRTLHLRLDEILARTRTFRQERVPGFRAYQEQRNAVVVRARHDFRIQEYKPKVMSAFVRNKLIDQVYLPLIGDNLAKQMGASGDAKRTDQMGLLLLISPPGYGKTTLMEYVANRLGLVFVKINGPALGHGVTSIDPAEAPNATARQEVEKVNFALEMSNNVLLYIDDIQHTNPEFLQKFISLTDAQRRIEGVWNGRTQTYDLRGKRFAVCMAGNPYTESGEAFRVPDMLANRADTYNLGDILSGREDLFELSYIENSLTSNAVLAPLTTHDPEDLYTLVKMASGGDISSDQLHHPWSAVEIEEMLGVLRRMLRVQEIVLAVNQAYIASAAEEDAFRTEPRFQLQGSYRNMNKLAEKVVAVMNDEELETLIDDHYQGEAQTLTTGAEANLLKLNEMRGTLTDAEQERWEEVKSGFRRVLSMGGAEDDPMTRAIGSLGLLSDRVGEVQRAITKAAERPAPVPPHIEATEGRSTLELDRHLHQLNETLAAVEKAADDAVVLANPRVGYLLTMLDGVIKEAVDPLLSEASLRADRGKAPSQAALPVTLLDDTKARLQTISYLLASLTTFTKSTGSPDASGNEKPSP